MRRPVRDGLPARRFPNGWGEPEIPRVVQSRLVDDAWVTILSPAVAMDPERDVTSKSDGV